MNTSKLAHASKFSDTLSIMFGYIEEIVSELHNGIKWKSFDKMELEFKKLTGFLNYLKSKLPKEFVETAFVHVDQHLHFLEIFIDVQNVDMAKSNFDNIRKRDLPKVKSEVYAFLRSQEPLHSDKEEKVYPKDHSYDFYKDILEIIRHAKNEVIITDNYPNEELINLYFDKIPENVKIRVLTKEPKRNFVVVAKKFKSKPNVDFEIRKSMEWHDRWVFVDNECWVTGQSVKDAGAKPTYLVKLGAYDLLKRAFDDVWNKASPLL